MVTPRRRAALNSKAPPAVSEEVRQRAAAINERLAVAQPAPKVELDHQNAWQLLIATILAARSNDRTINTITPTLFARWPTPVDLAHAPQEEVEQVVKSSGFFRNKAKAIRQASQMLVSEFGGEVPQTMEELTQLPGVARKTANVVLNTVWELPSGIIVDIHVTRLVKRFDFTHETDAKKIEALLCELFPRKDWPRIGHRLVLHGRHVCTAKKPKCTECPLNEVCPSAQAPPIGDWRRRAEWERVVTESRGETIPQV